MMSSNLKPSSLKAPHALATDAPLDLDGSSLTLDDVVAVARRRRRVRLGAATRRRIARCRAMVEVLLELGEKVYGLTTGFGKLRDVAIAPGDVRRLQKNLIMSHACGTGRPFPEDVARAAVLLRANTLCRGNSGVRVEVVEKLIAMLNDDLYPYIPEKGSVGASGDLAPLSHLALVLIGHPDGRYLPRDRRRADEPYVRVPHERDFAAFPQGEELERIAAAEHWTFRPVELEAKEGLAVNNGTQIMTAVGALTVYDAHFTARYAELGAALSLEAQRSVLLAYDPRLHEARPQSHQAEVAERIRTYCEGSRILDLYLNSGHLLRARHHLESAREMLAKSCAEMDAAPPADAAALQDAMLALEADVAALLPGEPSALAGVVDALLAVSPREQIVHLRGVLAPLRRRAAELLGRIEDESFFDLPLMDRLRIELVTVVHQLEAAVPEAPLVQDDYSFRCAPQVLAGAHRALEHVARTVEVELNSSTDNPLLFPPGAGPQDDPAVAAEIEPMDAAAYAAWLRADPERVDACRNAVLGGGNFHGQPIATAMDYLAIAMAEVGSIAERRVAHLVDDALSRGLPPFLTKSSGLNSGFMVPQYTAAALVSENKVLCHPASVDSIPTSANTEDHVSMGTHAARKAAEVVDNVLDVVAIEILAAYQGLKYRLPLEPGDRLRRVAEVLEGAGIERSDEDRVMYPEMRRVRELMRGALSELLIEG